MKMNEKKLKAILFDLDGVLINSFESWYQAFSAMLRAYGKEETSREVFKELCWGPGLDHTLNTFDLSKEAGRYCVKEQMNLVGLIELFPGVQEVLSCVKSDYKLKTGLVTNTPRKNVHRTLGYFHLANHFDVIISGDDVKKGKPDAEMVFEACAQLNVKPEEVLLVGDTGVDFQAGKSAGCTVIAVGTESAGDLHIENLYDLLPILDILIGRCELQ
jgi:HAD superfamily hydrolase (TIGR01509 family)